MASGRYPEGLFELARGFPDAPWMYTGGLENYPDLVDGLAVMRPLLGNDGQRLRAVRDPFTLNEVLGSVNMLTPECRPSPEGLPRDGSWLVKRRDGSGGRHVRLWKRGSRYKPGDDRWYWQRRIEGAAASAVFVVAQGRAVLLGVTRQMLGGERGREPFRYVGSQGPIEVCPSVRKELNRLGAFLAERFRLDGIIGADFVLADDRVWTIEVNPRLPASAELLDRTGGCSVVSLHVAACTVGSLPASSPAVTAPECEKRILFADRPMRIDAETSARLLALAGDPIRPTIADVPQPGTCIQTGQPVLTIFSDGGLHVLSEIDRLLALRK